MTAQAIETLGHPATATGTRRRAASRHARGVGDRARRTPGAPRSVELVVRPELAARACTVTRPAPKGLATGRPAAPRRVTSGRRPVEVDDPVRLTDRGLAVVMGLGAIIMLAALLCVGVTAARVTAPEASVTQVAQR